KSKRRGGITHFALVNQRSAYFDKIRKYTLLLVRCSTTGAKDSAIVLIIFAPIASQVFTYKWTTSIWLYVDSPSFNIRTSRSTAPPPRATKLGYASFAA